MNVNLQLLMRDPIFSQVLEMAAMCADDSNPSCVWTHMVRNCRRVIQGSTRLNAEGLRDALRTDQDSFLAVNACGHKALTQDQHCWADDLEALLGAFFDSMPAREQVRA